MARSLSKNASRLVSLITSLNRPFYNGFRVRGGQQNLSSSFVTQKRWKTSLCWRCGAQRQDGSQVFCENCKVIQPPPKEENYFKVFGLEERFDIDQHQLRDKFRQLQSLLHPDKFGNKSKEEQTISADYSSLLNKAFSSLHVPLRRAEHLLNLKGEAVGEEQNIDDPDFLMEIMSLNEEVEEAGESAQLLKELNRKNNMELETISKEIDYSFKNNDVQKAKANIIKFKYFDSISNRVNEKLRDLGQTD